LRGLSKVGAQGEFKGERQSVANLLPEWGEWGPEWNTSLQQPTPRPRFTKTCLDHKHYQKTTERAASQRSTGNRNHKTVPFNRKKTEKHSKKGGLGTKSRLGHEKAPMRKREETLFMGWFPRGFDKERRPKRGAKKVHGLQRKIKEK